MNRTHAEVVAWEKKHPVVEWCMICEKGVRLGIPHTCDKFKSKEKSNALE